MTQQEKHVTIINKEISETGIYMPVEERIKFFFAVARAQNLTILKTSYGYYNGNIRSAIIEYFGDLDSERALALRNKIYKRG